MNTPETESDFSALLEANRDKLVVVQWSATWCAPCKRVTPGIVRLCGKHPNVVFVKADVDKLVESADKREDTKIPAFHFVKGGKVVKKIQTSNPNQVDLAVREFK